ncbi:MAG: SDR family oxidoreductase, partial [Acidimicrobiaceae bacterium]|nr:SDR family oxidoreductase [Acidimicrobiaceae bacterium]
AGISNIAPALNTTAEKYRQVLEVNLVAPFMLAKAFGKIMLDAGSGSIVNVASVAGLQGIADRSAYNASKQGLIGLTRTLVVEWGARGVRVNAVCPGWVKTEMDHKDQAGGSYTDQDITDPHGESHPERSRANDDYNDTPSKATDSNLQKLFDVG